MPKRLPRSAKAAVRRGLVVLSTISGLTAGWLGMTSSSLAQSADTISLEAGWNLVTPQVDPASPAPASVFAPLGPAFQSAWTYDRSINSWRTYQTTATASSQANLLFPLENIKAGTPYWIYLAAPKTLSLSGTLPTTSSIQFAPGWNLVGFATGPLHGEVVDIGSVLQAAGANYDTILKWEQSAYRRNTSDTEDVDDFKNLDVSKGYQVRVTGAPFRMEPQILSTVRADVDADPKGNFPSYEDLDIQGAALESSSGPRDPLGPSQQTAIVFHPDEEVQTLSLSNSGGGILAWELEWQPTDAPAVSPAWLQMSRSRGVTTLENDVIRLTLDRTRLVKGTYRGTLTLHSNAGSRIFTVVAQVPGLDGEWRGLAGVQSVNGKFNPVPDIDLHFDVYEDGAAPGFLRGVMDSTNALLWPVDVPLTGFVLTENSNGFLISGSYILPPGDQNNPPYHQFPEIQDVNWLCNSSLDNVNPNPFPIQRTVTLTGNLVSGSSNSPGGYRIEGTYREVIDGMLRVPITVQGTFSCDRVSPAPFASRRSTANSMEEPAGLPVIVKSETLAGSAAVIAANTQTYERTFSVAGNLVLESASVLLDIAGPTNAPSPFPNDLIVSLVSPDNQIFVLSDGPNYPVSSLRGVEFPMSRAPRDSLAPLVGHRAGGTWRLRIRNQGSMAGTLHRWQLKLQGQPAFSVHGIVMDAGTNTGLPASVFLNGLPFAQTVQADSEGLFTFSGLPGVPVNFTATYPGYEPFNAAMPGIEQTKPLFADCVQTAADEAGLSARFRPLPGLPIPPASVPGYAADLGTPANPVRVLLKRRTDLSTLTLVASPLAAPAPAVINFTMLDPASQIPDGSAQSWAFGDGTTQAGNNLLTVTKTYALPGTYTATVTGGDIEESITILVMPSPGHTPNELNFFQIALSGGGTALPEDLISSGPNPPLKLQHADCANFDIDRAPGTTAANRSFDEDGLSASAGVASDGQGNFQGEDTDYFSLDDPCDQLEAAHPAFVPYPIPSNVSPDPDCSTERLRMICNIAPLILPATYHHVIPAPEPLGFTPPASPSGPDTDGIAKARDLRLVTGPLANY